MSDNNRFSTIIFKGTPITRHADGWYVDMKTFKSVNAAKRHVLKLISHPSVLQRVPVKLVREYATNVALRRACS